MEWVKGIVTIVKGSCENVNPDVGNSKSTYYAFLRGTVEIETKLGSMQGFLIVKMKLV